ncbi:MAG: amino acid adenylation domain-containing protein, partial [Planctomycetaceae bacterium]
RLDELSRNEEGSLFMTLLSAFQLLLAKLTGRQDIVVGSPIAGRNREELENLIGFFVNTQVLRTDLSGNPTFRELVRRVRETTLEAYANQDLPFEKLVEELQPERSQYSTPLFQVFFNMLNMSEEQLKLPGLKVDYYPRPETDSKFELTFYCRHRAGQLYFIAVYNAQLFSERRIAELLDQFMSLLAQVSENPDRPIESYSLVTERAAKLLPDPNAPLSAQSGPPVHELVAAQALKTPDRVAVKDPNGTITFGELESCSNRLASKLIESGLNRGDVVAIYAHRSASLVPAMLATWKAGGAFLILDPAQPPARLIECMKIAEPVAWIELEAADPVLCPLSSYVSSSIDAARRIRIPRNWVAGEFLSEQQQTAPDLPVSGQDKAYIAFTSGSTGVPKGIQGSHGPLSHFLDWHVRTFGLAADDRFSMLSGLGHDPLLRDVFTPLVIGATVVIPNPDDIGSDRLGEWMARERITVAHLTPAMGQVLAGSGEEASRQQSSVRRLFFGGDRLTPRDIDRAKTWAPLATCVNFYGATETPQAIAWHEVKGTTNGAVSAESIPVGMGIDDVQLLVLNHAGKLCGIGEVGTIHVRTPHLAEGYVNDTAQTAARFIVNPLTLNSADRVYVTGDLGRYGLDGAVEFLGRDDHQVKIRGYRVEMTEIESALRTHELVGNALLTVSEGTAGDRRLIAYIVPRSSTQPTSRDLRMYLKERLPEYMIPSAYVVIEAIPLTPNGKVNRAALPAPEAEKRESDPALAGHGAPQTESEQLIANVWRELLHIEDITVYDNFLDLGGHSLLGLEVLSRVQKETGVEIKPRELMFQTLGQIAALCDERKNSAGEEKQGGFAGRMLRSFRMAVGFRKEEK